MKFSLRLFNIYLLAAGVALAGGCGSHQLSVDKQYATLRVYLEGQPGRSLTAPVGRSRTPVFVESEPFLTEENVSRAKLVDNPDGSFDIQVIFDAHGGLVLDMKTSPAVNRGKHLIIFSHFPPPGWKGLEDGAGPAVASPQPGQPRISAWLAAPLIGNSVSEGAIHFRPEASHAEAELIVRGLNNMVSDLEKMGN